MPRLSDDGATVTLDLHGCRVDEALDLACAVVQAAIQRGRTAVRIIHGSSTSDLQARNRTIRHALHDLLDTNGIPGISDAVRFEDDTLLSLPVGQATDPSPLRLLDLR